MYYNIILLCIIYIYNIFLKNEVFSISKNVYMLFFIILTCFSDMQIEIGSESQCIQAAKLFNDWILLL